MNKETQLPDLLAKKQALLADIEGLKSVPLSLTALTNKINIQALASVSSPESADKSLKRVQLLIAIGKSNRALRAIVLPDANQQLDQVNQDIQEISKETQRKPEQAFPLDAPKTSVATSVQIVATATRHPDKNVTLANIPETSRNLRTQTILE